MLLIYKKSYWGYKKYKSICLYSTAQQLNSQEVPGLCIGDLFEYFDAY